MLINESADLPSHRLTHFPREDAKLIFAKYLVTRKN